MTGLVFFGLLVTWISRFGVVAWVLLVVAQALFVAAFAALVAGWGTRRGRGIVIVAAWVGMEVLRSRFPLGGFAWGVLGVSQHGGGPLLDLARIGAVFLVSAAAASIAVAIEAVVAVARDRGRRSGQPAAAWYRSPSGAALAYLVAFGVALPFIPGPPVPTSESLDIAAVQGNDIELPAETDRLNRVRIERIVRRMTAATERLVNAPTPDLVVWPENSLDNDYREDPALSQLVTRAKDSINGAPLIGGTLLDGPTAQTAYNTLVVIGDDSQITQTYRKRKLVPFGEYIPARAWLDWFPPLDQIPRDYLPGDGPQLFNIDGALVGPVTCFESVFGEIVRDQVVAGAQVLIVSTNNASFGRTAASRQHLAFSQLRAVETGRWVMHAGISGISGVVDPNGIVSQRTELFEQAVVRAELPLVSDTTPSLWVGPWIEALSVLATAVAALILVVAGRWGSARGKSEEPIVTGSGLVEARSGDG